ncbi:MAG: RidA family protein [Desulfovermiculus sp.]|nr:RidA family protein [Desulfovermiculus sp.]
MPASPFPHIYNTDQAPKAIGPYSQAAAAGDLLFISGQLPIDPQTGEFASGGIEERSRQCLNNVTAIAQAAETDLSRAVKVNIYLTDMGNFERVNRVYAEYFAGEPPARLAIQVAGLPKNADIEIEAVISL